MSGSCCVNVCLVKPGHGGAPKTLAIVGEGTRCAETRLYCTATKKKARIPEL
jgi:hypothetical protein